VSINARTEDDVDEQVVIGKVAKASGANYSFHKEQKKPMPAVEPVVGVSLFCNYCFVWLHSHTVVFCIGFLLRIFYAYA